jgi:hypothetical protein
MDKQMPFILILILALAACGAPSHPLTYVQTGDPVWPLYPVAPQQAAR